MNGFTGSVNLVATGLPSGVTAAFATNPTTGSSILTLTASASATAGTSNITITGTSGTLTATTTISLTVNSKTTGGRMHHRLRDLAAELDCLRRGHHHRQ